MKILKINRNPLEKEKLLPAINAIKEGMLVAFPTETVYGLGVDAFNENSVKRLYKVKKRPEDNPLIAHISRKEMLSGIVADLKSNFVSDLIDNFWPGPLTIILKKGSSCPNMGTLGEKIAVRMPSDEVAMAIIDGVGHPIFAPSANLSGSPSPTRASHVADDLGGYIDMIVEADAQNLGLESTVIDCSGLPELPSQILRLGIISAEAIFEKTGIMPEIPDLEFKHKHYKPAAEVHLYKQEIVSDIILMVEADEKAGALVFDYTPQISKKNIERLVLVDSFEEYARQLYGIVREFDSMGMERVFLPEIDCGNKLEERGICTAIMNRLKNMTA